MLYLRVYRLLGSSGRRQVIDSFGRSGGADAAAERFGRIRGEEIGQEIGDKQVQSITQNILWS